MTAQRRVRAPLAAAALSVLAGCAASPPMLEPLLAGGASPRVELETTPFFPQDRYQCGPAALATVLSASGAEASAEGLVAEVYLPGRRGTLQPELIAATRRRDRVPYVLPPDTTALLQALDAGLPVLVLQKLGAGPLPGWHYAVVVGYDATRDRVLLRSGTERRKAMPARHFLVSWERAERWAMLALPPETLPPAADLARYMEAAAGLEAVGRRDAAARAYEAAARHWPAASLPQLALANLAHARGDLVAAERGFRAAARLDPTDVAARNNRAEVLRQLGCTRLARREIEAARALATNGPLAQAVEATARSIAAEPRSDAVGCPVD